MCASQVSNKLTGASEAKLPVLVTTYNRPHHLSKVLSAVQNYQPKKLYIHVDGTSGSMFQPTASLNEMVISNSGPWKCDVELLTSQRNLGCSAAMIRAIDWFFENEEMGIILEDDCLPNQSFFEVSAWFLAAHREDHSVWGFGGDSPLRRFRLWPSPIIYSNFALLWGWATWSDRWLLFRSTLETTSGVSRASRLSSTISKLGRFVLRTRTSTSAPDELSWDYKLALFVLEREGLWGVPTRNLISNIGFGASATNTLRRTARSEQALQELRLSQKEKALRIRRHSSALNIWILFSVYKLHDHMVMVLKSAWKSYLSTKLNPQKATK